MTKEQIAQIHQVDVSDETFDFDEALNKINAFKQLQEDERKKSEYKELRRLEYLKLNQDELRFDDLVNGTTVWIDTINSIKAKFPKPE